MSQNNKKGCPTLVLEGECTIFRAQELKEQLLPFISVCDELEINLAAVTEVDTTVVQLLVMAKREMSGRGAQLRMVDHSPAMMEALDLYNLIPYFGDPVLLSA